MRRSSTQAQEAEPGTAGAVRNQVRAHAAGLESLDKVLNAQGALINAQNALIKALDERGAVHSRGLKSHDELFRTQSVLLDAQDALIKALEEQGNVHGDLILELTDRVGRLEVQAARAGIALG